MSVLAPLPAQTRPYVISWNLTYRCNLACEHCYLDAGAPQKVSDEAFQDRSELSTEECFALIDELAAFAPEAVLILTGGEPLLRRDILEIAAHAAERELWVVVGTNGVKITSILAQKLAQAGVKGFALSLDATDAARHDAFRVVKGAWENTVNGATILHEAGMPFIVQTTVGAHNAAELEAIAELAHSRLGAKVWNLYFLVPTGRGQFMSDISADDYDRVLETLSLIQKRYAGRMMVNAKCAPHYVRTLLAREPDSPFLKSYDRGAGGCPAGTHYLGIRPNGDLTPCPYLPVFGGNARSTAIRQIWEESAVFTGIRARSNGLGGRCGACELNKLCGGCRARAYGATGDYMAEDPLCSHQPGTISAVPELPQILYGTATEQTVTWSAAATERIKRVPAFVRGMVMKAVEAHCAKNNIPEVTPEVLDKVRASLPTQKIFGR